MKGTSIFNKSPWSNIHLPLPRTPRQSQQLLNALTSSFRRQLDREYPPHAPSAEQTPSPIDNDSNGGRLAHDTHSSAHATDRHLRAILENPLFSIVPPKSTLARSPSAADSIERQRWAKEPMKVFDEIVASGSVTASSLNACLKSQLLLTSPHTGEGFTKALKESRAGSKVVTWWFSSDSETRKILFQSMGVTASLLKFMVAEGLYDTVFAWLRMLAKCDLGGRDGCIPESHAQQAFRYFLGQFLEAEAQYGGGLGSSVRFYLQVCKSHMSTDSELSSHPQKTILPVGGRLFQLIMQNTNGRTEEIPAATYQEFMKIISMLSPKSILSASVPLYHPTHPDTKPFLEFVDRLPPGRFETWTEKKQEAFMRSGFDALRILIDKGNLRDCSFLARFMQHQLHGKSETGTPFRSGYHASPEEEDLLTRLDLALT